MKTIFCILLASVVLTGAGCTNRNITKNTPVTPQDNQKNTPLVNDVETETKFKMATECSKYKGQAGKYIEDKNYTVPDTGIFVTYHLNQIFYSSRINSCLIDYEMVLREKDGSYSEAGGDLTLEDFLTGKILETSVVPKKERIQMLTLWEKILSEYK